MIKVRRAYHNDYYRTQGQFIADGLSAFEFKSSSHPTICLQFTRNCCDLWVVLFAGNEKPSFYVAPYLRVEMHCTIATREQFFDFVQSNTPEAMDWCLFHLVADKIEIEIDDQ